MDTDQNTDQPTECIICYSARPCNFSEMQSLLVRADVKWCGCKLAICERCWLEDCRMLCPVCQRAELNTKRQCHVCFEAFHLRDVDACDVCTLGTCRCCRSMNDDNSGMLHFCSFIHQDVPILSSIEELCGKAVEADKSFGGIPFCAFGKVAITSSITITLLKDEVGDVGYTVLLEDDGCGETMLTDRRDCIDCIDVLGMQLMNAPSRGKGCRYSFAVRQLSTTSKVTDFMLKARHLLTRPSTPSTKSHLPLVAAIQAVDA